jgi:hypothetical protein
MEEASRGVRTADALCAHPFRQMYEAIDYQIARRIGYRIRRAGWSPFVGATDEAGPVSHAPRSVEVEVMASHHHD